MTKINYTLLFVIKGSALNRGMNTGIENLAWGLADLGCNVHILTGGTKPLKHDYLIPISVNYHFTGRGGAPSEFVRPYQKLLTRFRFDAVIGWVKNIGSLAHVTPRLTQEVNPRFIANQGFITTSLESENFFLRLLRRIKLNTFRLNSRAGGFAVLFNALIRPATYYKKIDHVIAISQAVSLNVQNIYGLEAEKCSVVHRGVDEKLFTPPARLSQNDSSQNITNLLYTGNITKAKGIEDVVDALKKISEPIRLVLCGNASKQYIAALNTRLVTSKLGPRHILEWRGSLTREELVREYQKADLFVFCSHSEGLGKSLIEAMACGLPVIVSDIPVFQEIVTNGKDGLVVPTGSSADIAKAVRRYLSDSQLRENCGLMARQTVQQNFSAHNEISSWLAILNEYIVLNK